MTSAATAVKTHLPAVHVSLVHSLLSLQSAGVVQPPQAASSPVPRHTGAVGEQPTSCAVPAAVSRQRTHMDCASQLRPVPHATPTGSASCVHAPATQLSL